MKRAKGFLALLMVAILLLNFVPVEAGGTATFEVQTVKAKVGKTVDVTISVKNNPGITSTKLTVAFGEGLSLTSVTYGTDISGNFIKPQKMTSPIILNWVNGLEDFSGDYVFATLSFQVAENATAGLCPIKVTYDPDDVCNVKDNNIEFDIKNGGVQIEVPPVSVTGVTLNKETLSIDTGVSEKLNATILPNNATNKAVTWKSSDPSVATVDDNGNVTALKKGTATITVKTEDGKYTAMCTVTVSCSHTNTTVHPAKASTCKVQGNNEYTTCNDCGVVVSGSDAKLPLANHIYIEKVEEQYLKSAATCVSKSVYYKSCSVCEAKGTETFENGEVDSDNHTGSTYIKGQKEATCYEEGYTGDTYCQTCNHEIKKGQTIAKNAHNPASVWTTNETDHWKECQTVGCGNIIDKAPHSGGEATCVSKAICSICKVEYGSIDPSNHKHTEVRDAKAATEQEKGYTGDTWCLDCDKKIAEGKDIEKLEHKPVLIKAESATAAKEGNIAYYYCKNCGKCYSDEEGAKEISKEDTVIAKLAPKMIEGNDAKFDKSSKATLSFRSDAAFVDFIRVLLDGKELVRDKEYTLKEGSIIATLTPEFAATLSKGSHTLEIVSTSGTATANFTVTDDNPGNSQAQKNDPKAPQTGDNSNLVLWCSIAIISLLALCTAVLISKRKKVK